MWTEITKDLVLKEAVDHMGYEYEETDDFFYVMEYLKYVSTLPPNNPFLPTIPLLSINTNAIK